MNKRIKYAVVVINVIIFIFSIFWVYKSDFQYEPIIVLLGQISSLLVLFFGEKITNKMKLNEISNSEVTMDIAREDEGDYEISNVKKGSKIKINKS